MASFGFQHGQLEDLVALLLAAGKTNVHGPIEQACRNISSDFILVFDHLHEVEASNSLDAVLLANAVQRRTQEGTCCFSPRDLHRVLKGQEQPGRRVRSSGFHRQQVPTLVCDAAWVTW